MRRVLVDQSQRGGQDAAEAETREEAQQAIALPFETASACIVRPDIRH